jgi:hypothetical protein
MGFDWNFQELMKYEQEAPGWIWMTNQLMRNTLEIHICVFLALFQELICIYFNFDFGWLRIGLTTWFRANEGDYGFSNMGYYSLDSLLLSCFYLPYAGSNGRLYRPPNGPYGPWRGRYRSWGLMCWTRWPQAVPTALELAQSVPLGLPTTVDWVGR